MESLGWTNLDFVEAQPLGESDQLFRLLHAPHLSAAALNDLGRRMQSPIPAATFFPSTSPLPLGTSSLLSFPSAHLAHSAQGLLGILLTTGPLFCLA